MNIKKFDEFNESAASIYGGVHSALRRKEQQEKQLKKTLAEFFKELEEYGMSISDEEHKAAKDSDITTNNHSGFKNIVVDFYDGEYDNLEDVATDMAEILSEIGVELEAAEESVKESEDKIKKWSEFKSEE